MAGRCKNCRQVVKGEHNIVTCGREPAPLPTAQSQAVTPNQPLPTPKGENNVNASYQKFEQLAKSGNVDPDSTVNNSTIGERSTVSNSKVNNSPIGKGATVSGSEVGNSRLEWGVSVYGSTVGHSPIGGDSQVFGSTVEYSEIGLATNVEDSTVKNSSVGECTSIYRSTVNESQIGDCSRVTDSKLDNSPTGEYSKVKNSTVRNSSIELGAKVKNSEVNNSPIGINAKILDSTVNESQIGKESKILDSTVNESQIDGAKISGVVERCVLGKGVRIEGLSEIRGVKLDAGLFSTKPGTAERPMVDGPKDVQQYVENNVVYTRYRNTRYLNNGERHSDHSYTMVQLHPETGKILHGKHYTPKPEDIDRFK